MTKELFEKSYIEALEEVCSDAAKKNEDNLKKIITDNKSTVFGRNHNFSEIVCLEDYRRNVPVSEYEYFEDYAKKEKEGFTNQLTVYKILSFCNSSGTTGNSKTIPVTEEAVSKEIYLAKLFEKDVLLAYGGRILNTNVFRTDRKQEIERSLLLSEIWNRTAADSEYIIREENYCGGYELLFQKEKFDYYYAKLFIALLDDKITIVEGIYVYDVLQCFDYLEKNYRMLLQDMKNHEISDSVVLTDSIRNKLLGEKVDITRIEKLEEEFGKGFDGIARRIWPKLKYCFGIGSAVYSIEEKCLSRYLGDVDYYYTDYASSEVFLGVAICENSYDYVLLPTNAFFEFLPYSEGEMGECVLPKELKVGSLYEPVITTFSGLYRYRLGDIVICVGYYLDTPVLRFFSRRNQAINLSGEKLTTKQIERVFFELNREEYDFSEYTFFGAISALPFKYILIASSEKTELDDVAISKECDKLLSGINIDYCDLRNLGALDEIQVISVTKEQYASFIGSVFFDYRGHNKPVHILRKALYRRAELWADDYLKGKLAK